MLLRREGNFLREGNDDGGYARLGREQKNYNLGEQLYIASAKRYYEAIFNGFGETLMHF